MDDIYLFISNWNFLIICFEKLIYLFKMYFFYVIQIILVNQILYCLFFIYGYDLICKLVFVQFSNVFFYQLYIKYFQKYYEYVLLEFFFFL